MVGLARQEHASAQAGVWANCAAALFNLSQERSNREAMVSAGALALLADIGVEGSADEMTRQHCVAAIGNLSVAGSSGPATPLRSGEVSALLKMSDARSQEGRSCGDPCASGEAAIAVHTSAPPPREPPEVFLGESAVGSSHQEFLDALVKRTRPQKDPAYSGGPASQKPLPQLTTTTTHASMRELDASWEGGLHEDMGLCTPIKLAMVKVE